MKQQNTNKGAGPPKWKAGALVLWPQSGPVSGADAGAVPLYFI